MFCVNRYQILMTFNFKNNICEYFIDFKVPIKKEIYGFILNYFLWTSYIRVHFRNTKYDSK